MNDEGVTDIQFHWTEIPNAPGNPRFVVFMATEDKFPDRIDKTLTRIATCTTKQHADLVVTALKGHSATLSADQLAIYNIQCAQAWRDS